MMSMLVVHFDELKCVRRPAETIGPTLQNKCPQFCLLLYKTHRIKHPNSG